MLAMRARLEDAAARSAAREEELVALVAAREAQLGAVTRAREEELVALVAAREAQLGAVARAREEELVALVAARDAKLEAVARAQHQELAALVKARDEHMSLAASSREREIAALELSREVAAVAKAREEQFRAELVTLGAALEEARADKESVHELDQLSRRADGAEGRAAALEAELATIAEAHATELVQLEGALRDRGKIVSGLEHEVIRRQRMIEELVSTLEESHADAASPARAHAPAPVERAAEPAPDGSASRAPQVPAGADPDAAAAAADEIDLLRAQMDALALEAARREGELATRGWRVAELERQLALRDAATPPSPVAPPKPTSPEPPEPAYARLQDELDALRQALTQEHAARTSAESGEELSQARAELARQAAVIEDLSRQLDGQDPGRSRNEGRA